MYFISFIKLTILCVICSPAPLRLPQAAVTGEAGVQLCPFSLVSGVGWGGESAQWSCRSTGPCTRCWGDNATQGRVFCLWSTLSASDHETFMISADGKMEAGYKHLMASRILIVVIIQQSFYMLLIIIWIRWQCLSWKEPFSLDILTSKFNTKTTVFLMPCDF